MRIAVAGATGTLGSHVIDAARAAGHETVSISRSSGTDLMAGTGLVEILSGCDAVIDVSATTKTSTKDAVDFFTTVTRNLLSAERTAGVGHHVAISIIGAAEVNANYYAGKAAQEEILSGEAGGWSLLRTTQFHEFAEQLIGHGRLGPLQGVPTMRSQPLAASEAAAELVGIAAGRPQGRVPDLAGPRPERMADLVKRILVARGIRRPVIELPLPGAWGRGMRDGSLMPRPGTRLGQKTFDDWLAGR